MELRLLRYFIAVAEELHFGRAAARVGIEQSPLSKAITDMERRLGVRLFIRTRRSTQLTYVGETLLPDARRILVEVDQAHRNIKAAALTPKCRGFLEVRSTTIVYTSTMN
jgi:DNA-binding transcriptional LysR family regulator